MSIVTQNSDLGKIRKPSKKSKLQVPERLPGEGVDFLGNDRSEGFTIKTQPKDTDFNLFGFPRTNFIDSRGNVPQDFNINKPFTLSINKENSRLLKLHNDEFNFKDYYAQAKGSGELGARRSSRGFTEPFIIRDVGDQWGERISPTDAFPTSGFVRGGIAVSADRAFTDAQRLGKFLLTPRGILFTAKQFALQALNVGGDLGTRANVYDPLSPVKNTVPFLHFDRHIDTPLSPIIRQQLESNPIVTAIKANSPFANARGVSAEKFSTSMLLDTAKSFLGLSSDRKKLIDLKEPNNDDPTLKVRSIDVNVGSREYGGAEGDKVNLIPYGQQDRLDSRHGKLEDLDFIPFKFKDVVNNKVIAFRAILSGITDTFSPEYSSERYVGRPDSVYVYQGTNREISFTFDVYPKTDKEMYPLWQKMNYLAGLTYPSYGKAAGGGKGMIAPFCQLTIGDMYKDSDGYISSLTFTVQDQTTWETEFARLPKYIQVACNFIYIGKRLPSSTSKHFEVDWVQDEYTGDIAIKEPGDPQGATFATSDNSFKNNQVRKPFLENLIGRGNQTYRDELSKRVDSKLIKEILNSAGF